MLWWWSGVMRACMPSLFTQTLGISLFRHSMTVHRLLRRAPLARLSPLAPLGVAARRLCRPVLVASAPGFGAQRRAFGASSPKALTDEEWEAAFLAATADVSGSLSHADSAAAMRDLLRTNLLLNTDLRDRPERFFKAHRLLARHSVKQGPGFWIRFTVHYNLCFGTVLAVGGPEQIAALAASQAAGELGCFALTERLAGVQSGLLVETQARYDRAADEFVLTTPNPGAAKNWISQGFVAEKAVVVADLTVEGERKGPHAFLMDLRRHGELVRGCRSRDASARRPCETNQLRCACTSALAPRPLLSGAGRGRGGHGRQDHGKRPGQRED